jgi:hypothetical protein
VRIGFATIFAWRPHVEHAHYVAHLAREAGHDTRFLVCDADLPTCYTRELHSSSPAWLECLKCRAGGLRSFESQHVSSIGAAGISVPAARLAHFESMAESSASTLGRFESNEDYAQPAFRALAGRLAPTVGLAYEATLRWIERERLDAVVLFNGRMDATRGVLEAAQQAGIRAVSLERSWFGDGIQMLPDENCLGLKSVDRMMAQWRDVPLTSRQASRAARIVASRFLRKNENEWRAYNVGATDTDWPLSTGRHRVLLIPSSRNEVRGCADREGTWNDRTHAYDVLMDRLNLRADDIVLRCHPNWGENIGAVTGERSEHYYTDWARRRGVHVIPSHDTASTARLIAASQAVVLNGGSAALEAGILGKQVIATTPSTYQQAGFQTQAYDESDIARLRLTATLAPDEARERSQHIARQTLRFLHTMVYRLPQFVPYVRLRTTTQYDYFEGADPDRLTALVKSGLLVGDDTQSAGDVTGEAPVLEAIANQEWQALHAHAHPASGAPLEIKRRPIFRLTDVIRSRLPRGDR